MADYYYAEFLFDPDRARFADVVEGAVGALMNSGCQFRVITLPKATAVDTTRWGGFVAEGLDRLREMCEEVTSEGLIEKRRLISFPPAWGRIMFSFDFDFDPELSDEIWDEEDDTGARATDLGLSFTFSPMQEAGRYCKLTLSFWEDFVLRGGQTATHIDNMRKIINILKRLSTYLSPYFGVMNNELHTNPDRSLELLRQGRLPEGNEYVYVGHEMTGMLNLDRLTSSGYRSMVLPDGAIIIEFTGRWGSLTPLGK